MLGDVGVWGLVIGIAGTMFGIFATYKRSNRKTASIWYKNSVLLAESGSILPEEVAIQFAGEPISHLKKMNIVFWNTGNVTIDKSDIVRDDPLRFALEGEFDVLKVSVAAETKPANGTKPGKSNAQKKEFPIEFTYLDPGQGWNLEVLYQGKIDRPVFHGTIKGIPGGFTDVINGGGKFLRRAIRSERTVDKALKVLYLFGMILLIIVALYMVLTIENLKSGIFLEPLDIFFVAGILIVGMVFLMPLNILLRVLWLRKYRPPADLLV